jgi:predicted transcriptional regulator
MKINLILDTIDLAILFLLFSGITNQNEIGKIINRKQNTVSDRFAKLIDLNLAVKNDKITLTKSGIYQVEKTIKKINISVLSQQIDSMSV